jgi:hypothetical protein
MRTVKITGHVYEVRYSWESASSFSIAGSDGVDIDGWTHVGPVEVHYAIPDSYSREASAIAALAAKREEVCKQFAASVRAIDEQISKLQALTCDGVAA